MTNKKAQGLEMSTIILAVLGVVILLILFALITGKIQWFGKGLTTCPGQCLTAIDCDAASGYSLGSNFLDPESTIEGETCAYSDPKTKNVPRNKVCCSSKKTVQ